jgi:hypothetical protein
MMAVAQDGQGTIPLQRGRLLRHGAHESVAPSPRGRMLEPVNPLRLYEEEVPRARARVTRAYQRTCWHDDSSHLWIGRRKGGGRGESFSGLRFDVAEATGLPVETAADADALQAGGAFDRTRFDQDDGFVDDD